MASGDGDPLSDSFEVSVFDDISDTSFVADIIWLAEQGITRGCSTDNYCPDDPITRGQMAAFLNRARDLIAAARQQTP